MEVRWKSDAHVMKACTRVVKLCGVYVCVGRVMDVSLSSVWSAMPSQSAWLLRAIPRTTSTPRYLQQSSRRH